MQVCVVQYGRRNDYQVAKSFAKRGLLASLITNYWIYQNSNLSAKIGAKFLSELWSGSKRYKSNVIEDSLVSTYKWPTMLSELAPILIPDLQDLNFEFPMPISLFNNMASRHLTNFDGIIYSLSDSMSLFKNLPNATKVHEQVNCAHAYLEALEYVGEISPKRRNRFARGIKAELESLEYSNYIVSPSNWITNNLIKLNVSKSKIFEIPYYIPNWAAKYWKVREFKNNRKLRVLFVGRVSAIKGIYELLNTANKFEEFVEFDIVGQQFFDIGRVRILSNVRFHSHLDRDKLIELYKSADLFVLPSYCEGSALVSYEAIGFGIPGIVSEQSGTQYKNETTGIVINNPSTSNITDALTTFLDNPDLVEIYSFNTMNVLKSLSEDSYHQNLYSMYNSIHSRM